MGNTLDKRPDPFKEFYREHREKIRRGEIYSDDECYNDQNIFNKRYWDLNYNPGIGTTCFEQDSFIHQDIDRAWNNFKIQYERKHNIN